MDIFRRMYVWLKRIRYRKGYGVHSPFAFGLLTDVVYERLPFYSYERLKSFRRASGRMSLRLPLRVDKLLLRLSNAYQPTYIMEVGTGTGVSLCYLAAGCLKARCVTLCDGYADEQVADIISHCKNGTLIEGDAIEAVRKELASGPQIGILHLAHTPYYREVFELCLPYAGNDSLFIVEGIYENREKQTWWKSVVSDERTGITFDLYDLGLVCFDKRKIKQHYIVNF